jgi:RNase adapter protein RapZ
MTNPMPFVILSGLSGAGKTQAIDAFEDAGYFCVDNLPPQLLSPLVDLFRIEGSKVQRVAVVCDVRGGEYFAEIDRVLDELGAAGVEYSLVFLEASDDVLVARFKETRRRHPLAAKDSVLDGIKREREQLNALRERANHIIDTSGITIQELKLWLNEEIIHRGRRQSITFSFVSFGYKYGIPIDADLLFDVRFLPNPFYDLALRPLTGLDQEVRDYVLSSVDGAEFFAVFLPLLDYLFPRYVAEGKAHLTIGIGCTGGRHRSVTIAAWLADHYAAEGLQTTVRHRDMNKG